MASLERRLKSAEDEHRSTTRLLDETTASLETERARVTSAQAERQATDEEKQALRARLDAVESSSESASQRADNIEGVLRRGVENRRFWSLLCLSLAISIGGAAALRSVAGRETIFDTRLVWFIAVGFALFAALIGIELAAFHTRFATTQPIRIVRKLRWFTGTLALGIIASLIAGVILESG